MILPDNLEPLPVSCDDETAFSDQVGFVSEEAVRQILVGPLMLRRESTSGIGRNGLSSPQLGNSRLRGESASVDERHDDAPAKSFPVGAPDTAASENHRVPAPLPRGGEDQEVSESRGSVWKASLVCLFLGIVMGSLFYAFSMRDLEIPPPTIKPVKVVPLEDEFADEPSLASTIVDSDLP